MIELKESELSNSSRKLKLENMVTKLIWEMGIQANLKGYTYLRSAIVLAALHPELRCSQLYEEIANKHQIKPKSVEGAIHYSIENTYDTNPKQLQNFFPYPITKPGNWEVIALAADKIRMQI